MALKDVTDLFKLLNVQFSGKIKVNDQNTIFENDRLSNIISDTKNRLGLVFLNQTLNNEEREHLSTLLAWLFNEITFMALFGNDKLSKESLDFQKAVLINAYNKERWWFFKSISAYISLLKQAISWRNENPTDPVSPLMPSEEMLKKIPIELVFHKIVIRNEEDVNHLIHHCTSHLIFAAPNYCNKNKKQEIEAREVMMEIFRGHSFSNKRLSVIFFSKYFSVMAEFTRESTQFFLSVMHTVSMIFKNIPSWIHDDDKVPKEPKSPIEMFFEDTPVHLMDFSNNDSLRLLVTYASEILFLQIVNNKKPWYNKKIPELLSTMLMKILDRADYSPEAVMSLRNLLQLDDQTTEINMLMKYLVITEVETTNVFSQKLTDVSETWKTIHDRMTKKIDHRPGLTASELSEKLFTISDFFMLAVQIDFSLTQRHQLRHGISPRTCLCASINDFQESQDPLMQFKDWKYKHISYVLIDKLENITQKLLSTLNECSEIDSRVVRCGIDIFSCIVKLSPKSDIADTVKPILVAIIASPFYQCLKDNANFNKLGGFTKVMILLPNKFKIFFDTPVPTTHLNKFKCDSIVQLSQLEISRISNSCWWLIENIITFIAKHGSVEIKSSLFNSFTNLVINNSDKFGDCVNIYQKLLTDLQDACILQPLDKILCLTGGDFVILKILAKDNIFMHTIICKHCQLTAVKNPKCEHKDDEVKRWIMFMKETQASVVSPDVIKQQVKSLKLNVPAFFAQSKDFKMEFFGKIPAMMNHSRDFKAFVKSDKGKALFEGIFVKEEKVLEALELRLTDIICNISKSDFDEKLMREIFAECFSQLADLAKITAYGKDSKMQSLTINLTFIFATNVVNENNMAKCFKIFLMFIIYNTSEVMGQAALLALQMAEWNGTTLDQLMCWHKTFIMRHVMQLVCANFMLYNTSLAASLINFTKRLNFPRMRDFVPSVFDVIISVALSGALGKSDKSAKLMASLNDLCDMVGYTIAEEIEKNFIKIYHDIYKNQSPEMQATCLKFFEETTNKSIDELLKRDKKKTVQEVLVYYNQSQNFVMEVMKKVIDYEDSELTDPLESIIIDIKQRFLGVLIYFEPFLTSNSCERPIKKNILLSLGEIIRLLTATHISEFCFKIITILKAAEQTSIDLSETCINVWSILIRNCNVNSLAPILSTIIVSLEFFIDKFPYEVASLHEYLIIDNNSLLSRNISDLFFIEKTRVSDKIKRTVLSLIESQNSNEEKTFKHKLQSLLRQMNNENCDLKILVYCLQYLKELIRENRREVNELICVRMTMDPIIEELLHILVNNCKNTRSEELQLATAECLGELGAIEPSLQQQNFASKQEYPDTIHSDEFAKMALSQLCKSYQYTNDPKYIDSLQLAVQHVLKSRNVTFANKEDKDVWLAIPEKMRSSMESLLKSSYAPKLQAAEENPIFWSKAQTAADWTYKWAASLIEKILDEETKTFLEHIKPSMRHNQYTTSLFLPYIVLHNLTMSDASNLYLIREEFQLIFDIVNEKEPSVHQKPKERKPLYVKWFNFTPIEAKKKNTTENAMKAVAIKVAKLIFEIFDFLENYVQRKTHRTHSANCKVIKDLINNFDVEEMAHVNYECGEYARAMIYIESKMKKLKTDDKEFQDKLSFLTNIYAKLECPDSVEGVQALKTTELSLEEKVLINNVTENFQDSAACFERIMQIGNINVDHVTTMMTTYISLDQPETALLVYEKMIRKLESSQQSLCKEFKAEPLWRLSRFDELDELLKDKTVQQSSCWGVRCGKLLSSFHKLVVDEGPQNFKEELRNTRLAMMSNLKISGSEQTAYGKNYRGIINLHLISELEKAELVVDQIGKAETPYNERLKLLKNLISELNVRMEFIRKNSAFEESILSFHRVILSVAKTVLQSTDDKIANKFPSLYDEIDDEMGKLWVKSTKLACKNKKYQQAQTYILNAEPYHPKNLFIEKAQLHWIQKDQTNAFKMLELGTKKILNEVGDLQRLPMEEKLIYSKAKLMIARYNSEAINVDFETNQKLFFEANVKGAENEKVFLLIAEYLDRFHCTEDENQLGRIGEPRNMLVLMKYYYKSLTYGSEFVFQSMPRLLSIWLDTTAKFYNNKNFEADFSKLNKAFEGFVEKLDIHYFYTAFSQLISRICHPSQDVFNVLKTILVKLMIKYPQQSLWFLLPMLKSSHPQRVKRCKEILKDQRVSNLQGLITDFNWLVDRFIKLATTPALSGSTTKILLENSVPELNQLNQKSPIIMPFQCNLQLIRASKQNSFKFTDKLVYIRKINSEIEVMRSLQRPRKVTLRGDDGKSYDMLFKAKDDLRIDLRYCEFSNVLKEFLHKDPESRHRQLTTRTYSVIPLNENSGLIEWVPNLRTLKSIITSEYDKNKNHPVPTIKQIEERMKIMNKTDKVAEFRRLKQVFYPALDGFFRQQFATPQNYYKARMSFIKTTAVMSIVGYILGLGDRHCENILIDVLSGETFHVDFNMLFNRGETQAVPETVPFRLTHNMTDAMGVLGIEGPFKKNCEIVLRVLQNEKNTLMSYLRPLVYDAANKSSLEVWKKNDGKRGDHERVEQDAVNFYNKIELRLQGIVSKYRGSSQIPLSTEGQVNFIIGEATNEENLALLFYGWMPWI